jgi:hypothetical protein
MIVYVLSLVALILPLAMSVGDLQNQLKSTVEARDICRADLMEIQNRNATALKTLMALNPEVLVLRKSLEYLEFALLIAPPLAKPEIEAAIRLVKLQQRVLDKAQKLIILTADNQTKMSLWVTQTKLVTYFAKRTFKQSSWVIRNLKRIKNYPVKLAVKPDKSGTTAPLYETKPQFTEAQKVKLEWTAQSRLGPWLSRWLNFSKSEHKDFCSASLKENNTTDGANSWNQFTQTKKWTPVLTEGKYF